MRDNMVSFMLGILITIGLYSFSPKEEPNPLRDFHIEMEGLEKVKHFEQKYPQIVRNNAVYIAYLQRYYKGHEDAYISLIK